MVSLWVLVILYDDVWNNGIQYVFGLCWYRNVEESDKNILDVWCSVEMGLQRELFSRLGCPVCIWLLQPDADIYITWIYCNVLIQRENLVYILSNGNHDTGNM